MGALGLDGMVRRIRSALRLLKLGISLAAGLGITLMVKGEAQGAAQPACQLLDIKDIDPKTSSFMVQPLLCDRASRLFGTVVLPDDPPLSIRVNTTSITPRQCGADTPTRVPGAQCFDVPPLDPAAGNLVVVVAGADGTPWKEASTGAASWLKPVATLLKAPAPALPEPDVKPEASAQGGSDPCAGVAAGDQLRWCQAYDAGLRAAGLSPRSVDQSSPHKPFSEWNQQRHHIADRGDDVYVLFFSDVIPVEPVPLIDEDDTVVLVVVPSDPAKPIEELRVTECNGAAPVRVGGLGKLPGVAEADAKGLPGQEPMHRLRIAKECSADGGIKAVVRLKNEVSSKDIQVKTLALHRFTVGLGLIYDFSSEVEFRAASVKGENTPVVVRDQHRIGLSPPVPFITFRPVLVDTRRERRISEWFGLSLGISLAEPLEHLYLGLLVEPWPGFGVTGGVHFQTVPSLAGGYVEGDRFPSGEVPVDRRWSAEGAPLFVGLNVDASLLAKMLEAVQ
ncbi:hypothetical protein WME95_25450 [Sorangium sp. So ce327]|uniref:hypothetical protein n=1 Tax=Sorangium sp. So ce327 TaxID=3133301 RepID=UPI003F61C922